MKLVLGTSGFDVTQFQLKLRRLYPNVRVTGTVDESTLRDTHKLCELHGIKFCNLITSEIVALLDRPTRQGQSVCVSYTDSRERAAAISKSFDTAGIRVKYDGTPKVFIDDNDLERDGADVIFYRFKSWPLDTARTERLNKSKLVVVSTPFEAYCLSPKITTELRVLQLGIDTNRYIGANTAQFTVGYYGSKPDDVAKIFQQAIQGSKCENHASLICSEPVNSTNPRVVHSPVDNAVEWLAPLTCLISSTTSHELHHLAAAIGKAVLVPAIALPDHGLSCETGILVDNAFYTGSKPVLGLPFSQDALVFELAKLANDPERAVRRGLAAAQANKLVVARMPSVVSSLLSHLALSP